MNSPEAQFMDVRLEQRPSGHVAHVMVNNPKHRNRLGKAGKEVKFGIPSGMEACLLPGLVGWGKARELVFTGELMDAQEAHRCGFVDRLVTPGEIDAAVEKWVLSICAAGVRAIRLQKALVQDWERMSIKDAVQRGIAAMGESRSTDEPVRLMQAFIDRKRNS